MTNAHCQKVCILSFWADYLKVVNGRIFFSPENAIAILDGKGRNVMNVSRIGIVLRKG